MQISKVRVGRFYTLTAADGSTEKVLAYGMLRETGQPPKMTVKAENGALFQVRARYLTPIESTAEESMTALIFYVDGFDSVAWADKSSNSELSAETPVERTARVYAEAMARS